MNDVGVFSFGREQSQRCPNKMLRPFADTTLTDLVLSKLSQCGYRAFFAGYEDEFRAKSEAHGVAFVRRDLRSVLIDEPISEILSFIREIDYKYLLLVSACLPFLRATTINRFLDNCVAHDYRPAFSVRIRRTYFMTRDRRAVNFDPAAKTINTKRVEPLYEFVHALYFFDRAYFLEHGTYWDWKTVRFIEVSDGVEMLDIDTEDDFQVAECLWRAIDGR